MAPNLILGAALLGSRDERIASVERHELEDSALYQAALFSLYTGESSKDLSKIKSTLQKLRELDPDNGYFMLMESYYNSFDRYQNRDRKAPALPLKKTELAEVIQALDMPDFDSMSTDIAMAPIEAVRSTGNPFAEAIGYNHLIWILHIEYVDIMVRLRQNIHDAIEEKDTVQARQYVETMLMLAQRIEYDDHSYINTTFAYSMKRNVYSALTRINELEGRDNKKVEEALAAIQPNTISKHPYLLIPPIPSIHRAILPILIGEQEVPDIGSN